MIQVRGPDGAIVQFPDGTPSGTIQQAMSRHYGGPTPAQMKARRDAQAYEAQTRSGGAGPFEQAANQIVSGSTLGLSDELAGAAAAARTGFQNLIGRGPGYGMADAYHATRQAVSDANSAFQGRHPIAAPILQIAGGLSAPGAKLAGGYVAAAPRLGQAIRRGALVGAAYGGVAGAGSAEPGQRVAGAGSGALAGAATGAVLPVGVAAARQVARTAGGAAVNAYRGARNLANPVDPMAAPSPQDTAIAQQKIQQFFQAAGVYPADLANHPAVIAGKPITTAEALGRNGVNQLGTLARRSGPTGDQLATSLQGRAADMPGRILNDFATATGIHPEAAAGDIDGLVTKLRGEASPLYTAALSSPDAVWNPDLAALSERPVIKKAIDQVGKDMLNAGQNPTTAGLVVDPDTGLHVLNPDLSASTGQFPTASTWDAVKQAIGRQVERNLITGRALPDSASQGNFGIRKASQDLTSALAGDPANGVPGAIPGYRAALDKAGDYLSLQDAFDRGQKLFTSPSVNEADFAKVYGGLDDPSRQAFLGGIANSLQDMAQNGRLKPATFKAPRIGDKLATVAGDDNASQFLDNVKIESQLAATGNRMMPGVNSPTFDFSNAAAEQEGGPNVLNILHVAHNPLAAVGNLISAGKDIGTNPQVRSEMGRILMQDPRASVGELSLSAVPPRPPYGFLRYMPALAGYSGDLAAEQQQ